MTGIHTHFQPGAYSVTGDGQTGSGTFNVAAPIFQSIVGTSESLPTAIDVNGTAQATVVFDTTGASAGDALVANTQVASPVTASGSYPWSVQVVVFGTSTATFTSSGTAHLAVSSASEGVRAGDGWTFAGVNRLIATSDGVIWKDGQGFGAFFAGFSYMYVGAFPAFGEFDVAYGFGTYYAAATMGGHDIEYPGAPANNVFSGDWIQAFS